MSIQSDLQAAIQAVLPDVACVIGWGKGPDALHGAPLFMRTAEDVDGFEGGFFAVNNPALFLPEYKGTKIGVVVKGCDSRSVGQLLAEGLIKREEVVIIGYPCTGVLDNDKVAAALKGIIEPGEVLAAAETDEELILNFPKKEVRLKKADILADKCTRCLFPNSLIADTFVGEPRKAEIDPNAADPFAAFDALTLEERQTFWNHEMSRCIRCYACRNACPLCVCRDHCVASSRSPEWITQADGVADKLFFQIIHATHLAGRCTGCGECQRACPENIPVVLFKRALNQQVTKLFSYRAGVDIEGKPPLLTFTMEEPTIKERDW